MTQQNLFLDDSGHVSAAEMARYVDGTSDRESRTMLTHHLADCDVCREELTALRRLVPRRSHTAMRASAFLAAAAAVVVITMTSRGTMTSDFTATRQDAVRATTSAPEIATTFLSVSPAENATVSADSVHLRWRSAGTDATYRLWLFDESGSVVFSVVTADTVSHVPTTAFAGQPSAATGAHPYYWRVDAQLLDGESVKSGPHRVQVR